MHCWLEEGVTTDYGKPIRVYVTGFATDATKTDGVLMIPFVNPNADDTKFRIRVKAYGSAAAASSVNLIGTTNKFFGEFSSVVTTTTATANSDAGLTRISVDETVTAGIYSIKFNPNAAPSANDWNVMVVPMDPLSCYIENTYGESSDATQYVSYGEKVSGGSNKLEAYILLEIINGLLTYEVFQGRCVSFESQYSNFIITATNTVEVLATPNYPQIATLPASWLQVPGCTITGPASTAVSETLVFTDVECTISGATGVTRTYTASDMSTYPNLIFGVETSGQNFINGNIADYCEVSEGLSNSVAGKRVVC